MDKLDRLISETLDDEDREILDKIGRDQNLSEVVVDLFRGNLGWLNGVLFFGHLVFLVAGIYAGWRFFTLTDLLDVLRWGLCAAVLLLASLITRVTLVPALQVNRVMRALKHLEMQIALMASKR